MSRCLISKSEVQGFIERCMTAVGTKSHHAHSLAKVLVEGDYRGHYSHGLNRMDMYVKDIETGICAKVEKETAATALVDGKNLLGPVVGNFCMNLTIKKAKEAGIGWVVARGSNHYGIAGYYAMQALKENMIGMSFTNTSPLVVPTRGKDCTLGTNPISMAAPAKNGDSFVLDMATSAVALGKGQCFVAINPENFAPGFADRMADLLSIQTTYGSWNEKMTKIKKCEEMGGIPYHISVVNYMNKCANRVGASPLLPCDNLIPN